MHHRDEIDGLRAVAVIPVILFHAGFEHFRGGFVGVDVFLVISGYLITTIILSEKEKGHFSLLNFYERRARRIIPALFFVMFVSIILSWLWLSPFHMKDFSQSLVGVSIFSSNILFWQETGYWGVENELKPLLHTWSLAVEEQYYMLFPLFLILMWRFSNHLILGLFLISALGSLALSHWAAYNLPTANFFLLPMRGWELAVGAGIAFYFVYRKSTITSFLANQYIDEALSWVGIGLIAYAIFVFDESTPFPSLYTLIPTIGTALVIIFSSQNTFSGKLLSSKAFVAIGLISYSAYLWHQPIFVFARHKSLQEPSSLLFAILSILSLVMAFVSWKYIEAPFRKQGVFTRKQIFSLTAVGSLIFITFGVFGHLSEGYKFRIDPKLYETISLTKDETSKENICVKNSHSFSKENPYCILVPEGGKLVFLYGDSHAQTLRLEAKKAFSETDYGLLFASNYSCPPVKGVYRADMPNKKHCYRKNNRVYEDIANNPKIEYVILSARWTLGMEGSRFDNMEGGIERGSKPQLDIVENGQFLLHNDYSHKHLLEKAYVNSIQYLLDKGKKVILIYSIPEAGWNVPDYMSRVYLTNPESIAKAETASTSYQVFIERNKRTIKALDSISENKNLFRIRPDKIFCNSEVLGRCITQSNGSIFYMDDDHLSNSGAKLVMQQVIEKLE